MHLSLRRPSLQSQNPRSFVEYTIYVNGIEHSRVRYSQLHEFNKKLRQLFDPSLLPRFPPKSMFNLAEYQIQKRQEALEKYLQTIGQSQEFINSPVVRKFLLQAQIEQGPNYNSAIVVWLPNENQIHVTSTRTENTEYYVKKTMEILRVSDDLAHHFSLFIQKCSQECSGSFLYLLQDIDVPQITLANAPFGCRIMLRKNYWNPSKDMVLMFDTAALNVLYMQTVSDVKNGWIFADEGTKKKLSEFQKQNAKREYLELARTLKFYGYMKFEECVSDYPELGTEVMVFLGYNEIVLAVKADNKETETGAEYKFRIIRIKSWRVTESSSMESYIGNRAHLAIEYCFGKDKLKWVTITSEFSFLISVCLQNIVDEMVETNDEGITEKNIYTKMKHIPKNKSNNGESSKTPATRFFGNGAFDLIGDEDL